MSKYSICVIDDKLPAHHYSEFMDDTKMFNENNIKHLLSDQTKWEEAELFSLMKDLFEHGQYLLSGFRTHDFFLNHIEEDIFSPDIIVFDWDVDGDSEKSKQNLLKILRSKYCLIAIYTGADKEKEVTIILEGDEFQTYKKDRLFLIEKEEGSVEALTRNIEERLNYFSFKLGQILKRSTLQSIDNILIHIGKLSFDQFVSLFGTRGSNNKKIIAQNDFVDIVIEKLKYELNNSPLEVLLEANAEDIDDLSLLRELWRFRLYHHTRDNIIRKGDILQKGGDENKLFLVLSSDCHLNGFLKKTLGHLAIVPVHKIVKENIEFKKRLNYRSSGNLRSHKVSSLVNPQGIDFLTILPSLTKEESNFFDYALNARECFTLEIELDDSDGNRGLLLQDVGEYTRVISVSEPFMSALYQFISANYSGFGLPDFSEKLWKSMSANLQELKKDA